MFAYNMSIHVHKIILFNEYFLHFIIMCSTHFYNKTVFFKLSGLHKIALCFMTTAFGTHYLDKYLYIR